MNQDDLRDQYRLAVEEYRFQVNLNWSRAQYYFVLDAAILAAGIALYSSSVTVSSAVVVALFSAGVLVAVLAMFANHTGHTYYRAIREVKRQLESDLALGKYALATTPGMGGKVARLGRVRTFQLAMLVSLAIANFVGLAVAVADVIDTPTRKPLVEVRLTVKKVPTARRSVAVVSRDRVVVANRRVKRRSLVTFRLEEGKYKLSVSVDKEPCEHTLDVGPKPLQTFRLSC